MKRTKNKKKLLDFSISFLSLVSLAAINYTIIHSPYVFLMTFILFIHELGHYLTAKNYKAKVKYPIFIPFPFFAIAFTKIKDLNINYKTNVAAAGVLFSSSFIILLIASNIINYTFSFYFLYSVLFTELFFNFIGLDGHRYRQAKYNL